MRTIAPKGGLILAIFLHAHYVFDPWVPWRRRRGDRNRNKIVNYQSCYTQNKFSKSLHFLM